MPTPTTQEQLASTPKTESGSIDLRKAIRIAEGGTHILYRFPEAPFVVKLMRQNPNPIELAELERKYAVLYDCFDKDRKKRCIREEHVVQSVLLPGNEKPQEAALSIVPYETCFSAKVKFDFKMEPIELDPELIAQYQALFHKAHTALIRQDETDFDLDSYAHIDARIGGILVRLDNDPQLQEVMTEFLDHYRDFYQKTDIILDAMGFENILFFKDQEKNWQFKIGSVIKHDTGQYTQKLFSNLQSGQDVERNFVNFTHTYFSPANIRAVNACAMKLGLKPIIPRMNIDSNELVRASHKLSLGERLLACAQRGDFNRVEQLFQEQKDKLAFNFENCWVYSRIADEYIRHGQPPKAVYNFLTKVADLPVVLPPKSERDEGAVKHIKQANAAIFDRIGVYDNKVKLHRELITTDLTLSHKERLRQAKADRSDPENPHQNALLSTTLKPPGQ